MKFIRTSNTIRGLIECVNKPCTHLTDREREVLTGRLMGKTLNEIGAKMKPKYEYKNKKNDGRIDIERVRQIEAKAIRKFYGCIRGWPK